MSRFRRYCLLAATTAAALIAPALIAADSRYPATKNAEAAKTFLHKDWQVQSSCDDKTPAEKSPPPASTPPNGTAPTSPPR